MAGALSDIGTEIKETYPKGTWRDMVNKEAPYAAALKKRTDMKVNEGLITWPLRTKAQWNIGIIDDNEAFPTAKDPTRLKAQMRPEIFAGSIKLGFKAKAVGKSEKSSFHEGGVTADRIEGTAEDIVKYKNKVYAGSVVGRLGVVLAEVGVNTMSVDKPLRSLLLNENMSLEVRDALTGGAVRDSFTGQILSTIAEDTDTLTYAGTDRTVVAGDHIFITGSYGRLPYSLQHIVDDATQSPDLLFTLSRASNPQINGQVERNGGSLRDLDEQLILKAIEKPRRKTGKKITRALSNIGQAHKYVEFVAPDRRYPGATTGTQSYSIGFGDESLNIVAPGVNCKLEVDRDISPRKIFFLAWDTFFHFEAQELDWADEETLLKLIPSSDTHKAGYLAYICSIENQGNTMPPANCELGDLKDATLCGDA
jgi:hypothetical protein